MNRQGHFPAALVTDFISTHNAAQVLGVDCRVVRAACSSQRIPCHKITGIKCKEGYIYAIPRNALMTIKNDKKTYLGIGGKRGKSGATKTKYPMIVKDVSELRVNSKNTQLASRLARNMDDEKINPDDLQIIVKAQAKIISAQEKKIRAVCNVIGNLCSHLNMDPLSISKVMKPLV